MQVVGNLMDSSLPMYVTRSSPDADDTIPSYRRWLHSVASKGFPPLIEEKLRHAAHIKSQELLFQDTSVASHHRHLQNSSSKSGSSGPVVSKNSLWTFNKEKNGVLLCHGYSASGEYMVKASVNASTRVAPLATMLDMNTSKAFNDTMSQLGSSWFGEGEVISSLREPSSVHDMYFRWMTWGVDADLKDFTFLSHTKLYDGQRDEVDGSMGDDDIEFMTQLWDSVDLFPLPCPHTERTVMKNSGFLVERTRDRDVCRVSFVLCIDRNRKREKWMDRMAYTLVHEIAVKCRDVSAIQVALKHEFGNEHHCSTCLKTFTMFRRRHHCRLCTGAICNVCSTTLTIGTTDRKAVRACLACSTSSNESTFNRRLLMTSRRYGRAVSAQYSIMDTQGDLRTSRKSGRAVSSHYSIMDTQRDLRSTNSSHIDPLAPSTAVPSPRSSSRSSNRSGRLLLDDIVAAKAIQAPPVPLPSSYQLLQHHQLPKKSFRSSTTTTLSSQELSPPTNEFAKLQAGLVLAMEDGQRSRQPSSRDSLPLESYAWEADVAPTAPTKPTNTAYVFQGGSMESRPDSWRRTEPRAVVPDLDEETDTFDMSSRTASSPRNDLIPLPRDLSQPFMSHNTTFRPPPSREQDSFVRPSLISVCSDYEF
ncbi:hypothetical protein LEN26_000404 [Aphanomyces euteiches]|nr:hypothetical protein AeMF1_015794 [Aphanomyces euteiches]KAH9163665.1 hypothetical protein LEN26_000404 [Aphanomyces euteiches]KAH9187089.1 hypothetical protein AeNC1_010931 [Aphanomyces euteiches]